MQNEAHPSSRQLASASSIDVPPSHALGFARALKFIVIATVLFALLGVDVTLRIVPQLGIISNVAIIWFVSSRLAGRS